MYELIWTLTHATPQWVFLFVLLFFSHPFFSVNFYFKNTPLPSSPTFSSSHPSSNPVTVSLSLSSLSTFLHPFCLFPSPLSVPLCCILLGAGVIFFFPFWILDSRFTQFSELFLNNKCFKV